MRRICGTVAVVLLVLAVCEPATARTVRVAPAARAHAKFVFRLTSLRGKAPDAVSGRVLVGGKSRRELSRKTVRRAIRRGRIVLHIRGTGGHRIRLAMVMDERRPSRPGNLQATTTAGGATLTWNAAGDDVGIARYMISRDGRGVATAEAAARSWSDAGLQPGRSYRYAVRAIDRAGNSSSSATTSVNVPAAGVVQAPSVTPSPSGQPIPATDLPGWQLRFSDDFTTNVPLGSFPTAVASRWRAYQDRTDTSGRGLYAPDQVLSVHDGVLDWWMHSVQGQPLVAAALPQMARQTYGRYAVRFRSDSLPGYKVAWLLWPDGGTWPQDGEIDYPEGDLDSTFCGFVHHQGATTGDDQDAFCNLGSFTPWHTAVTEWSPGLVQFFLDGQLVGSTTTRVPSGPMFWVLQSETALGGPAPSAATSGHILLDWAVAWSRG